MVDFLKRIDRCEYIQGYLEDALMFSKGRTSTSLHCYKLLAFHFIEIGKFLFFCADIKLCINVKLIWYIFHRSSYI